MTQAAEQNRLYTVEEYFQIEKSSDYRNEYYDGYIYPMAAVNSNHNRITGNLRQDIGVILDGSDCEVFTENLRVYIQQQNYFVYPDVMVVCGSLNYLKNRKDTITNPIIVFEVLSKSTRNFDRTDKFKLYRKLDTFKEYVLIDQYQVSVEHFWKDDGNTWKYESLDKLEDIIRLQNVLVTLSLNQIYRRVEFPAFNLRTVATSEQEQTVED